MKNALAIVLLSILSYSFSYAQQYSANTRLPNLNFVTTADKTLNASALKGKNILVVFLPDCDHCQREATEIRKDIAKFKGYNLFFISSATKDQLNKFAKDYKLTGISNVAFAQTSVDQIRTNFGPISTPSLYIYSDKGKLVKAFNGETEVKEIVKFLN